MDYETDQETQDAIDLDNAIDAEAIFRNLIMETEETLQEYRKEYQKALETLKRLKK